MPVRAKAPTTTKPTALTTHLTAYVESLFTHKQGAEKLAVEAKGALVDVESYVCDSQEKYEECAAIVKEAQSKFKFFDEQRKVTVTPLNDEVKRVNDWYRPGLDALKKIGERGRRLMADFVLRQRQEEQRLLDAAQVEAQKVLATDPDPIASAESTSALVQQAAEAAPQKVAGIGVKPVYRFEVVDADKLAYAELTDQEYEAIGMVKVNMAAGAYTGFVEIALKALLKVKDQLDNERGFLQPDMKALAEWVSEHGRRDIPAGVEVKEDVNFSVRT